MKNLMLSAFMLIFGVSAYAQDYKIKNEAIVKLNNNKKVLATSESYNMEGLYLKDIAYKYNGKFVVAVINTSDYSTIDLYSPDLVLIKSKDINESTNIKAVAINDKDEIVVFFSSGNVLKFNSELTPIK